MMNLSLRNRRNHFASPRRFLPLFSLLFVLCSLSCATTGAASTPGTKAANAAANAAFATFEAAIAKSFTSLDSKLKAGSRLALLPISAADKENGDYAYDTITVKFTNSGKYDMLERARINEILQEQNFQMSGMVSDETAVSIGKMLGAQAIIVGDISDTGNTRRLVFRCLDVETGKILGISSERF